LSGTWFRGSLGDEGEQHVPEALFATVGDNCIDRFLPPVGDCLVGGNAVNVAVQLARLGRRVGYFGAVGDDAEGAAVRAALSANGVETSALRVVAGEATARTDIETLPDGDRRFVFESFGACLAYRPDDAEIARLRAMRHVHVGWLRGTAALRQALAGSGVVLSQDLSVNNRAEDLDPAGLDIAFSSSTPEDAVVESERLLAAGARLAVVTLGASGSLANDMGKILRMPGLPVSPVDTTGAGDAFIAGFLDAHAKQLNLQECLAAGSSAGRLACRHRGGFPQAPLQAFVHDTRGASERVLDRR
jgi:fructoselysine 6-kinase